MQWGDEMDREKVIKGLECCMKWTGEPNTATCHCSDCSYTNMDILGQRCLIDLINDALALLNEQEAVVRCKDCEHCYFASNRIPSEQNYACGKHGFDVAPDWFCADGEKAVK